MTKHQNFIVDMEKVKELTYRKLWTWADLARNANITEPTIYALQFGRRKASLRTVYKIAKALSVEPSDIIKEEQKIDKTRKTVPFDEDFEHALISYERYSLGRKTYVVGMCVEYIMKFLKDVSDKTLWVMQEDLEHPLTYGDPFIDKPEWMKLKEAIKKELEHRERRGMTSAYK